jgi:hypothetical protein
VFRVTLNKKPETMVEQVIEFDQNSIQTKPESPSQLVKVIKIQSQDIGADKRKHGSPFTKVHNRRKNSIMTKDCMLGSKNNSISNHTATKLQSSFNSLEEGNASRHTKRGDGEDEPGDTDFLLDCIEDVDQTILKIQDPYRPLGMNTCSSKNSIFTTSPSTLVPFVQLYDQGERSQQLLRLPNRR